MSDSLDLSLRRQSDPSKSVQPARASGILPSNQSDGLQGAGDAELANISKGLDQCRLERSTDTENGTSIFTTEENPPTSSRTKMTVDNTFRAETTISDSHIAVGRDINLNSNSPAYHVTGTLIQVTHRYEESAHGAPKQKQSNEEASQSRGNVVDDMDDITASMMLPAPPLFILERDYQHSQIVAKLLAIPNARIPILGMGGIGKTTLACSVAYDSEVIDAYSHRLFLSFEGCSTPDLAYTNLATAFQVPADRRSSHRLILSYVLNYLWRSKTLLIIDNYETFWEVSSNRRAAEDLLAQVSTLPKLALIVTLRGIQRPGNIRWLKIEPLQTLTPDASKELLSIITDEEYAEDALVYVLKLLNAVAGIPLAVTLIGSLLRDASETPQSLWGHWTRENARAIRVANEIGVNDRLYELDISLRVSIFGPRMSENAKDVLASIAILPTGLNVDEKWLDKFQELLPSTIRLRACIRTLRDVALVSLDISSSPHRYRLLPPVRDFCLDNLSLNSEVIHSLIDLYNADVQDHHHYGSTDDYTWVTAELININAVFNHAITLCYVTEWFGPAVSVYTEWGRLLRMPEMDTVERAIGILSEYPQAQAKCLWAFGFILSDFNRIEEAIHQLERALFIYRGLGDKHGVGSVLYILGRIRDQLGDYNKAEEYLKEARVLFGEVNAKVGPILEALAATYYRQKKFDQAIGMAKEAFDELQASGNRKGEFNALGTLGRVYLEQGEYDLAAETLTTACDLSKVIHDPHGEACMNQSLGFLYWKINKPDQAAQHFLLAASLFEQAQDPEGAENVRSVLRNLGMSSSSSE